ncbi:LIM and calponin homology domains-containing protein 1-like isoform X3 [Echeneis naucrates]|uniref:LIM and calponin homology domains-containing protein 1-like isoform X3 n=1 Tax=Echeneis naucrates TaxID=173247 RepID=UPI001113A70D|nr:LIM and calponin homology domains-containing protein 1-like isoform X3 [Echeneis naucrates]
MASPAADIGQSHQHHPGTESAADSAFQEAQKWIEAVTGRCFGDKDFRGGLENGILLCELLSSIKPSLVKKINRLPTPIAGLDNLSVFLRGCEELGLKGSQLFDPGDLQDTSTRPTAKGSDCSRKLKNVLITIYWLGRAANGCTSYNGPTLDLKEFEGLLSQMRKEAEEAESPKRSIRDSGYIDCWDSERSDSLSPPRHGREDSFDSLDSFGSRSRQTPSPDVLVARGSSDGRGSDSESDGPPHRKMPDIRKDDMLARRTSVSEPRTAMPFNQYLPNKSNQSGYVPTPLRKKKNDKEDGGRKSWSTATSPIGGDRPFSTPARSCSEELFHHSSPLAGNALATSAAAAAPFVTSGKPLSSPQREEAGGRKAVAGTQSAAEVEQDERQARRALTSPKRIANPCPSHFLPVPSAMPITSKETSNTGRRKGRALSESDDPQGGTSWLDSSLPATFSHTDSVSDDSQSVSMIDMRGEEEAILQPHSQVRHELMHNQYNRMKEEDDHWQDDLARWKNRRRSISQDLIKKEEERKMMERLMSGDTYTSHRRRSIKTYREIVEDKERREEELREAYRQARTPEEASAILQRYAQRFSISEAVLERLQLPKLLDRSMSADPSFPCSPFPLSLACSPTTPDPFDIDPNGPMRYLRQLSAPAPKFTSTLEARIEEFPRDFSSHPRPQIRSRSSEPPSTRALSPKQVPLLTPKPYFESRATVADHCPSKTDGLLRINGSMGSDDVPTTPESRRRESPPQFQASPSKAANSAADVPSTTASPQLSPHTSPTKTKEEAQGGAEATSEDVAEQEVGEQKVAQQKVSEQKVAQQKVSEQKVAEQKVSEQKVAQQKVSEQKVAQQKVAEQKVAEQKVAEQKVRDQKVAEQKVRDQKVAEQKVTEQKVAEQKVSDQEVADQKVRDQKVAEQKVAEQKVRDQKVTEQKVAEQKVADQEVAQQEIAEQKVSELSTPLCRPTSLPTELQKPGESFRKSGGPTAAAPVKRESDTAAQTAPPAEAEQEKAEASDQNISSCVQLVLNTQQRQPEALQVTAPSAQELLRRRDNVPETSGSHPPQETTAEEAEKDHRGNVSVPVLPQARRGDRWSWDPDEERKRQERWQQEQERMLQEKYRREQEKLKDEWEKAQREVAEEERKYHEEERKILEETVTPLTPRSSALPSPSRGELPSTSGPQDTIVRSLADWERKQEILERQSRGSTENVEAKRRENDRTSDISTADDSMKTGRSSLSQSSSQPLSHSLHNGQKVPAMSAKSSTPVKKQPDLTGDSNKPTRPAGDRRSGPIDNNMSSSKPPAACSPTPDTLPPTPNRSVSGKKLCSSCGQPLGKGAAMIIETLSLYFHIHCFKCGVCKGQLGDTTTGTDVRIRNGLLNCHQCYIRSRSAGQPTTL